MNKHLISSQELIKKFEMSYSSLTHYTNIGLLKVISRKGNKRLYDVDEVTIRIPKIWKMADKGYPLKVIAEELNSGK